MTIEDNDSNASPKTGRKVTAATEFCMNGQRLRIEYDDDAARFFVRELGEWTFLEEALPPVPGSTKFDVTKAHPVFRNNLRGLLSLVRADQRGELKPMDDIDEVFMRKPKLPSRGTPAKTRRSWSGTARTGRATSSPTVS
jgi:hypothetical protein